MISYLAKITLEVDIGHRSGQIKNQIQTQDLMVIQIHITQIKQQSPPNYGIFMTYL